jgi:hypothetical protein
LRVGLLASSRVDLVLEVEAVRVRFLLAGACIRTSVGSSAVSSRERSSAALSQLPSKALA